MGFETDDGMHKPPPAEEVFREDFPVWSNQRPPILGEAVEGDVLPVLRRIECWLRETISAGRGNHSELLCIIGDARGFKPDLVFDHETRNQIPKTPRMVSALMSEFNTQLFLPQGIFFRETPLKLGEEPSFHQGALTGFWTDHEGPMDSKAWIGGIDWDRGGEAGFQAAGFCFVSPSRIAQDSHKRMEEISQQRSENYIYDTLLRYIEQYGLDPSVLYQHLLFPYITYEEAYHQHDRVYIEKYRSRFSGGEPLPGDTIKALSSGRSAQMNHLVQTLGTDPYNLHVLEKINAEISGKLQSICDVVRRHIQLGNPTLGYMTLLLFLGDMEKFRQLAAKGKMTRNPIVGLEVMNNVGIATPSDQGVIDHCEAGPGHPCERGLQLLESSLQTNIKTIPERAQLLTA